MKIYKITEAGGYLGISINVLKTLADNNKIKSLKTIGRHRRSRQKNLDVHIGADGSRKRKIRFKLSLAGRGI